MTKPAMLRRLADQPWLRADASQHVMAILEADGRPARFVGGCVRDSLLQAGLDAIDIDIATAERPDAVLARLEQAGIKVVPTGLQHGTVTAIVDDRQFEITTLRQDVTTDGRHAEVLFTDDFDLDASRRDFTINAMRSDRYGDVVDPFGGMGDLAAGLIRFVGDPGRRVQEDYLRILRYFRFFARFGQLPVDFESVEACRHSRTGLDRIAGERIRTEMAKLLVATNAIDAARLMIEAGVHREIALPAADLAPLGRLSAIEPRPDWLRRLAAWLRAAHTPGEQLTALAERWRLANADQTRLRRLCLEPLPDADASVSGHRRRLYRLGSKDYRDLLWLAEALASGDARDFEEAHMVAVEWQKPIFPLNGEDLKAEGLAPGPEFGAHLKALEKWWLEQDFGPDRSALLLELKRRLGGSPGPSRG